MWKLYLLHRPREPSLFAHTTEPCHDKTNKMTCAPSKDSDQPGHLPSLIRVFTVHIKKHWVLNHPLSVQQRLWSDWVDAQADQVSSLRLVLSCCSSYMSQAMRKCVLCHMRTKKGADRPVHPRSLISTFIVRCQDRMIPLVYISEISRF